LELCLKCFNWTTFPSFCNFFVFHITSRSSSFTWFSIWSKSSPKNRYAIRIWRRVTKPCFDQQPSEPIRLSPTKSQKYMMIAVNAEAFCTLNLCKHIVLNMERVDKSRKTYFTEYMCVLCEISFIFTVTASTGMLRPLPKALWIMLPDWQFLKFRKHGYWGKPLLIV
jgi:hypothetical protein